MKFEIIDYTTRHYQGALPEERGGKFIQIERGSEQYLVMSPMELHGFHANIAEAFLDAHGIKGRYNSKRDHFYIDGTDWVILGGGIWRLSEPEGTLHLGGASMAYGSFVKKNLPKLINATGVFDGLQVIVE